MAPLDQEEEDRITATLQALSKRDGLSIMEAATEFKVEHHTLRRRLKGTKSVKNNGGKNKVLNADQMKALLAFLDR